MTRPALAALDMAGTTIDDHGLVYDVLREVVEDVAPSVRADDLQRHMGTEKAHAIRVLAAAGGVELTDEQVAERFDTFRSRLAGRYADRPPVPLPGVEDALAALRASGVRVALTTGFSRDIANSLVEQLNWRDSIDALVCGDEVAQGRPAPYMIFRAMERTGVLDPREVLAAGDTAVDLQAATHAGCGWRVGVLTGKADRAALEAQPHTHVVEGVRLLPQLLRLAAA